MTDFLIYLGVVTLVSYAILALYFDAEITIAIRGFFDTLRDRASEKKHKIGYFVGYLGTCYFCMSYWVSWAVATALYFVLFKESLSFTSAATIIIASGLFSVAMLDMYNAMFPYPGRGDGSRKCFFPWNEAQRWNDMFYDYDSPEDVHKLHCPKKEDPEGDTVVDAEFSDSSSKEEEAKESSDSDEDKMGE